MFLIELWFYVPCSDLTWDRFLNIVFLQWLWNLKWEPQRIYITNVSLLRFSFQIPKPLPENYMSKGSHVNSEQDTLNYNLIHQSSYDKNFILKVKCNLSINLYILYFLHILTSIFQYIHFMLFFNSSSSPYEVVYYCDLLCFFLDNKQNITLESAWNTCVHIEACFYM
jgi:hypothetical protein